MVIGIHLAQASKSTSLKKSTISTSLQQIGIWEEYFKLFGKSELGNERVEVWLSLNLEPRGLKILRLDNI
jgi:hypothetical protein